MADLSAAVAESASDRMSSDERPPSGRSSLFDGLDACKDVDRSSLLSSWSRLESSAAVLRTAATSSAKAQKGAQVIQKALAPRLAALTRSSSHEQCGLDTASMSSNNRSSRSLGKLMDISHLSFDSCKSLHSRDASGSEGTSCDGAQASNSRTPNPCNVGYNMGVPASAAKDKSDAEDVSRPKDGKDEHDYLSLSGTTGETPIISHGNGVTFRTGQHSGLIRRLRNMEAAEEAARAVATDYSMEVAYARGDTLEARQELAASRGRIDQLHSSHVALEEEIREKDVLVQSLTEQLGQLNARSVSEKPAYSGGDTLEAREALAVAQRQFDQLRSSHLALEQKVREKDALVQSLTEQLGELNANSVSEIASLRLSLEKVGIDSRRVRNVCSEWESATMRLREERRNLRNQVAELESAAEQQEIKAAEDMQWWKIRWWQESVRVQEEQDISAMLSPDTHEKAMAVEEELRKQCEQHATEAIQWREEAQRLELVCASNSSILKAHRLQSEHVARDAVDLQNALVPSLLCQHRLSSKRKASLTTSTNVEVELERDEAIEQCIRWREEAESLEADQCSKAESSDDCHLKEVSEAKRLQEKIEAVQEDSMRQKKDLHAVQQLKKEVEAAQEDVARNQQEEAALHIERLQKELQLVRADVVRQQEEVLTLQQQHKKAEQDVQSIWVQQTQRREQEAQADKERLQREFQLAREVSARQHQQAEADVQRLQIDLQAAREDAERCHKEAAGSLDCESALVNARALAWEERCAQAVEESTLWCEEAQNTRTTLNSLRDTVAFWEGRYSEAENVRKGSAAETFEAQTNAEILQQELMMVREASAKHSKQEAHQMKIVIAEMEAFKQNEERVAAELEVSRQEQWDISDGTSESSSFRCELLVAQAEARTWRARFKDASKEIEICQEDLAAVKACKGMSSAKVSLVQTGMPEQNSSALSEAHAGTATAELRELQAEIAEVAAIWQDLAQDDCM